MFQSPATLLLHTRPCFVIDFRAFRRRVRARHERRTLLRQAHRPKLRGRRVWKGVSFAKRAMNLDTASLQRHGIHHKPADDVGTAVASAVQDSGQRQPVRVAAENEPLPSQESVCVEQFRSPVREPLSSTDIPRRCVEKLVCAELCFLWRRSSACGGDITHAHGMFARTLTRCKHTLLARTRRAAAGQERRRPCRTHAADPQGKGTRSE